MNRMDEYHAMLSELEHIPDSDPVRKAQKRKKKENVLRRSLTGIAAAFCVFVGLVNLSPTVSAACRELPFLKELVELLTFNPSLRIALEHDYVQMVGQEQTKDGITGRVEYLIVDQKQVNIFFTLTSEAYENLDATPELLDVSGAHLPVAASCGGLPEEDDALRKLTIDFMEEDVPASMTLLLRIRDAGSRHAEEAVPTVQTGENWPDNELPELLTELSFDLHLDPLYTGQGQTLVLNKTVELGSEKVTITDMEIYPTHIRINVKEEESNASWLQGMKFYLELEDGSRIETISNGISATGNQDASSMVTYRAESSYFYEADCIRLYITSADFLDKERERIYVNFNTLESDPLPQGVKLWSAKKQTGGTKLTLLVEDTELDHVQVLSSTYYDLDGNEYYCGSWSSSIVFYNELTGEEVEGWGDETYYLEDFHQEEAVFELNYTHFWIPEEPVVVELKAE